MAKKPQNSKLVRLGALMILAAVALLTVDVLGFVASFRGHDGEFLVSRGVADILLLVSGVITIILRFQTRYPISFGPTEPDPPETDGETPDGDA